MASKEEVRRIAAQCKLSDEELEARAEKRFKEERLRPLHDECKEHPFWRTFSNDFHGECVDKFRSMLNTFIGNFSKDDYEKCPHAVMVLEIMHNIFDATLKAKLMPKYQKHTIMETKAFGNYILCLQTALQIVHYYLDGIFDEDSMVVYDPLLIFNKEKETYDRCEYKTFSARSNGDGTYRLVRIITKDEIPAVLKRQEDMRDGRIETAKYFREHGNAAYAATLDKERDYYQSCVDDLIDNKEKHFIIK